MTEKAVFCTCEGVYIKNAEAENLKIIGLFTNFDVNPSQIGCAEFDDGCKPPHFGLILRIAGAKKACCWPIAAWRQLDPLLRPAVVVARPEM